MNWREFWNRENSIYVNDRHRALHDDRVARDIAALIASPGSTVLDYGCGEASSAALVAEKCERLYLYDAAPLVREHLRLRFSRNPKVAVCGADGLGEIADRSLDLVVVNSVLQYLQQVEFEAFLDAARGKLKPAGRLVIADVIPTGAKALDDISALLNFALRGGFFFAALAGLVATFFSDYRKLRARIGLTRYDEAEIIALFAAHGFLARRAAANIGHNQTRMMFTATLAGG
jgi:ubiquinone/menaquinone biosynthesis C-methylase UbiE